MSWIARKTMKLGDTMVKPGNQIPQATIDKIPAYRFGSLVRLGMLQEVEPPQARAEGATPPPQNQSETSEGETCPECGSGPFVRLSQHIDRMHGQE